LLVRPFRQLFLNPEAQLLELKDQECNLLRRRLKGKRQLEVATLSEFRHGFKTEGSGTTSLLLIFLSFRPRFSCSNNTRDCSRSSSTEANNNNSRRSRSSPPDPNNSRGFSSRFRSRWSSPDPSWAINSRLSNLNRSSNNRLFSRSSSNSNNLLRSSSHNNNVQGEEVVEVVVEVFEGHRLLRLKLLLEELRLLPMLGWLGLLQLSLLNR